MDKTRTLARSATPTCLFWNERGAIACAHHTPYEGSDSWNWERWEPLPVDAAVACGDEHGKLPCCETCGKVAALPPR